ncbi:MAG TPA: hypothetical protein PK936_08455 [Smithellaceae bacterium]|nr:hypothetical protein [Smithellaceae bacterium]
MTDTVKQSSLDVLVAMNTVVKNIRFYPLSSALVMNGVENLYQVFLNYFKAYPSFILSESERTLLIGDEPLTQKDHEKPYVVSTLEILLKFNIKSIALHRGLEKRELVTLLAHLAKDPEKILDEGGLQEIIEKNHLSHIRLDEKIFVAKGKNQKIVSSLELTDDQILQYLSESHPELQDDLQKILEMTDGPEWLLKFFEENLSKLAAQENALPDVQLAEKLTGIVEQIDQVSDRLDPNTQQKIRDGIDRFVGSIGPGTAREILLQNQNSSTSGTLMRHLVGKLRQDALGTASEDPEGAADFNQEEPQEADSLPQIQENIERLLGDSAKGVLDEAVMSSLVRSVEALAAQKERAPLETIMNRFLANMFAEDAKVRDQAARALIEIVENLPDKEKQTVLRGIAGKLLDWVKLETLATQSYRKICDFLRDHVNHLIWQDDFHAAIPMLDFFNDVRTGVIEKNDTIHEISVDFIDACASDERIAILFNIFKEGEPDQKRDAGEMLIRLGDAAMNQLLDLLKEQRDSNERVRIMRLIISAGRRAIPPVRDRIGKDQPWFYLRNIAYILSHVGDESSAEALQPLLLHENIKVRLEALKGINRTGKSQRCALLLSVLPQADHKFMINIVDVLGSAKCAEAEPALLILLENNPIKDKDLRANLQERICAALGSIGLPNSIPTLSKIVETKSFLGISRYPENVKAAAARALASIKKR